MMFEELSLRFLPFRSDPGWNLQMNSDSGCVGDVRARRLCKRRSLLVKRELQASTGAYFRVIGRGVGFEYPGMVALDAMCAIETLRRLMESELNVKLLVEANHCKGMSLWTCVGLLKRLSQKVCVAWTCGN